MKFIRASAIAALGSSAGLAGSGGAVVSWNPLMGQPTKVARQVRLAFEFVALIIAEAYQLGFRSRESIN